MHPNNHFHRKNSNEGRSPFHENRLIFVDKLPFESAEDEKTDAKTDQPTKEELEKRIQAFDQVDGIRESVASKFAKKVHQAEMKIAQLNKIAITDRQTGLLNRGGFEDKLRSECDLSNENDARKFGLIMIEIDRFYEIRNSLGEVGVDHIAFQIADQIKKSVEGLGVVAHYQEDWFAVLMPNAENKGLAAMSEQLRIAIQDNIRASNSPVTISLGYTQFDKNTEGLNHPAGISEKAGVALCKSRYAGGDRVSEYREGMSLAPHTYRAMKELGIPTEADLSKMDLGQLRLELAKVTEHIDIKKRCLYSFRASQVRNLFL
jgi:diguanylate cyclase (GGDEF)-like protein